MTTPKTRPKKTIKVEELKKEMEEWMDRVADIKLKTVLDLMEKLKVKELVEENPNITVREILSDPDLFYGSILNLLPPEALTKLKQKIDEEKAINK